MMKNVVNLATFFLARDHVLIQIQPKLVITSLSCDIKAYPNVTMANLSN